MSTKSTRTQKGLGKGFGSLLPQDFDQSLLLDKQDRVQKVLINDIAADPNQPRRFFDEQAINELAASIKRHGILQPLVVTESAGSYKIVAGERRFRAAQKAGLDRVPVIVRSLPELEQLEVSLIENVQRVDLNPLEQAVSIAKLHEQFNLPYPEIAKRLGKAHTTVVNIVRLLQLPEFAREALSEGKISEGHARQVLALKDVELQKELVESILKYGWTVRMAEQYVSEHKDSTKPAPVAGEIKKPLVDAERSEALSSKWGFKFKISPREKGGKLVINFDTREKFDQFIEFLDSQK